MSAAGPGRGWAPARGWTVAQCRHRRARPQQALRRQAGRGRPVAAVRRGEIFGFLGPNGSGKTTSIRMMCGLLTPDAGSGTCLGYDILPRAGEIKRRVGYMTQRFSFWDDLTIRENLDFIGPRVRDGGPPRGGRPRARRSGPRRAAPGQLTGTLSGGWKQRLALARLHAAPAAAAAARRADGGRRSQRAARVLGRAAPARRRRASRCSSARTTWTRPSAATSSPTSPTGGCSRRARRPR